MNLANRPTALLKSPSPISLPLPLTLVKAARNLSVRIVSATTIPLNTVSPLVAKCLAAPSKRLALPTGLPSPRALPLPAILHLDRNSHTAYTILKCPSPSEIARNLQGSGNVSVNRVLAQDNL